MKLSSILSVRNVLRTSGVLALCVGVPMVIIPPLGVSMLFGKREDTPEPDKKALDLTIQALGVAITASAAKSLIVPVSKSALAVNTYQEAMYACFHVANRFCGRWTDAKGRMKACSLFACAAIGVTLVQILSLCCGDEPEEKEE